jgi:hypothetical protein
MDIAKIIENYQQKGLKASIYSLLDDLHLALKFIKNQEIENFEFLEWRCADVLDKELDHIRKFITEHPDVN